MIKRMRRFFSPIKQAVLRSFHGIEGAVRRLGDLRFRIEGSILAHNQRLFLSTYNRLSVRSSSNNGRVPQRFPDGEEHRLEGIVAAMRRDGCVHWPGLFADPGFLAEARDTLSEAFAIWKAEFAKVEDNREDLWYGSKGWGLRRGDFQRYGRMRVNFFNLEQAVVPPLIRRVMDDPRLAEVAVRYYGAGVKCRYVLAENLHPSEEGDTWHFDSIGDQFKVMILLSDVGPENGPMRYKLGSHQKPPPEIELFYHQTFRRGLDYGYPSLCLAEKVAGEIKIATGRAGDCFLFDTIGLHAGSRCQMGTRLSLVVAFEVDSRKNRILKRMRGGVVF
jgi:hypothetical protein